MNNLNLILEKIITASKKASKEILKIYNSNFKVNIKKDNSPVTLADLNSNKVICNELSFFKDIKILSEENNDDLSRLNSDELFIVDPLDGTQDFVNKDDSFAINIAYVYKQRPLVTLIYVPKQNKYVYAIKGKGSYLVENDITTKLQVSNRKDNLIYIKSNTHNEESETKLYTNNIHVSKVISSGASTKAILIAQGIGDASIRFTSMTKEWDICPCDLIIKEAGGCFLNPERKDFLYNKKNVINHNGYIMINNKDNIKLFI